MQSVYVAVNCSLSFLVPSANVFLSFNLILREIGF